MPTVLITTDFSAASSHALDYACMLLSGKEVRLDLLHIFSVPLTYTADGIALAALSEAIEGVESRMTEEIQRVRSAWPGVQIDGRVVSGGFLTTLREETRLQQPLFVVLGTAGITDLFPGDADPLNVLRAMYVPVLFVPQDAPLQPIRHIAYACNYAYAGPQIPVHGIIELIQFMNADLQVVHTDAQAKGQDQKQAAGELWLKDHLASLQPQYHWQQDEDVLQGITGFLNTHDIDCLLVVPRKHGIWENLFHQSRTKALARMNRVPIIAFHPLDVRPAAHDVVAGMNLFG